jgi:6-phosphofructokinase 1
MQTFDDVTIFETMGRGTGWLAAASVLLKQADADAPQIVLIPERPVDETALLERISEVHRDLRRVFIVTNEMLTAPDGSILGADVKDGPTDALGRTMYSLSAGTGNYLAQRNWKELGLQTAVSGPAAPAAPSRLACPKVDFDLALRVGREACDLFDLSETGAKMLTVSQGLNLAWQPVMYGTGRTPIPKTYYDQDDEFGIGESFSTTMRHVIGHIAPIFPML